MRGCRYDDRLSDHRHGNDPPAFIHRDIDVASIRSGAHDPNCRGGHHPVFRRSKRKGPGHCRIWIFPGLSCVSGFPGIFNFNFRLAENNDHHGRRLSFPVYAGQPGFASKKRTVSSNPLRLLLNPVRRMGKYGRARTSSQPRFSTFLCPWPY